MQAGGGKLNSVSATSRRDKKLKVRCQPKFCRRYSLGGTRGKPLTCSAKEFSDENSRRAAKILYLSSPRYSPSHTFQGASTARRLIALENLMARYRYICRGGTTSDVAVDRIPRERANYDFQRKRLQRRTTCSLTCYERGRMADEILTKAKLILPAT